jgi:exodeoxyribonuclease V alpha subunit
VNLLLCAPPGRAAQRMTEATGFEAKTIHRLQADNYPNDDLID